MRLYEIDLGSARDVLAVIKGEADRLGQPSTLPFTAVMQILKKMNLGINTPDGLIALKNAVDPNGDVIKNVDDNGTVTLNTKAQRPDQTPPATGGSPTIDAMASKNAKNLKPDI